MNTIGPIKCTHVVSVFTIKQAVDEFKSVFVIHLSLMTVVSFVCNHNTFFLKKRMLYQKLNKHIKLFRRPLLSSLLYEGTQILQDIACQFKNIEFINNKLDTFVP